MNNIIHLSRYTVNANAIGCIDWKESFKDKDGNPRTSISVYFFGYIDPVYLDPERDEADIKILREYFGRIEA